MKYMISFVVTGLFVCSSLMAQETVEKAPTYREYSLNQNSKNNLEVAEWSRYVYRSIINGVESNSPLFYRTQPSTQQVNLFALIVNLLKEDKVKASRFDLQNSEASEEISLKQVLDLYNIPYATRGSSVSVNEDDLPTNEVMSYYVKERWYFDSKTGKGGTQIVAICPVIHRQENLDVKDSPLLKNPLFWISFDDLRPYLIRYKVSLSSMGDLSKARTSSLYDYFANRFYKGDIYQIGDRNLYQFYTTPQDLAAEQARLEKQLNEVGSRLKKLQ